MPKGVSFQAHEGELVSLICIALFFKKLGACFWPFSALYD
jgi:hypothetical protein